MKLTTRLSLRMRGAVPPLILLHGTVIKHEDIWTSFKWNESFNCARGWYMPLLLVRACELMCFWERVNSAIRQDMVAVSDRYKSGVDPGPMSVECRPAGGIWSAIWSFERDGWNWKENIIENAAEGSARVGNKWRASVTLDRGLLRHFHINFTVRGLKG
jgi:hypothetical protein